MTGKPKPIATRITLKTGEHVYYPLLVVRVEYNGKAVGLQAVVDSGADSTIIPAKFLAPLGVDFAKLPLTSIGGGAGGSFERRMCSTAVLKWGGTELFTGFLVAEPGKLEVPLLGREDFFKLYVTTFEWHTIPPTFTLEPVPAPAPIATTAPALTSPAKTNPKKAKNRKGRAGRH